MNDGYPILKNVELDISDELPIIFAAKNYPNPFNPETVINYDLPEDGQVTIEVFNILGQKVKTLLNGKEDKGRNKQVIWNGKDSKGSNVASGIYFYRISTKEKSIKNKMLLVK